MLRADIPGNLRWRGAFTLIELVMVIALLSVIAIASFIAINSYQAQHLRAAAERLATDLRYARNLALTTTRWHGATFSLDANQYTLYETDGSTDTTLKKPENPKESFTIDLSSNYQGVSLSSINIGGGTKVEFNPLGVPYTDKNGSALTSAGIITLSGGGSSLSVRIAPETGRIYLQ